MVMAVSWETLLGAKATLQAIGVAAWMAPVAPTPTEMVAVTAAAPALWKVDPSCRLRLSPLGVRSATRDDCQRGVTQPKRLKY